MSTLKQNTLDGRAERRPGTHRLHRRPTAEAEHTTRLCPRAVPAAGSSPRHRRKHHPAFTGDRGEYDHVAAAAYLMKHCRPAALAVLGAQPGNPPIGVITEADIARAVADVMDVNKTRIHDLLTARPAAIPAAASIRDAARTMVNGGSRQLPVADGTGWIGIVDIADVCGALLAPPAA
jgi:hypothetical protein